MSLHDYEASRAIVADDPPFYALVMAAMRRADGHNLAKLRLAFPLTFIELEERRYSAPGGRLPGEGPGA